METLVNYTDTYSTYKQNIRRILTWLANANPRCSTALDVLGPVSDKRPTNTSADAGDITTQEVALGHVVELARTIRSSSQPSIRLPDSLVRALEQTIQVRKEADAFYSRHKSLAIDLNDAQTRTAAVLEEALSILQPAESTVDESDVEDVEDTTPRELFDSVLDDEQERTNDILHSDYPKENPRSIEYDLESTESECFFAIFAFFHDVNNIRDYLEQVWRDYLSEKLDLMSAAVTTDTAFTLLQCSWDRMLDERLSGYDYASVVDIVLRALDMKPDEDAELSDWLSSDIASLMEKYVDILQVNPTPVPIPGALGTYNPHQDRTNLSVEEKKQEDRILLMELLPEFSYMCKGRLELPTRDFLTTGLKRMIEARSATALPTHALIATKILLDIHHILRDKADQPFQELQSTAHRTIRTIDSHLRHSHAQTNARWKPEHNEMLRHVRSFAKQWALTDQIAAVRRGARGVKPRPFHLLKNHPILCGLLVFRLNVLMNDVGIMMCNAWGSLISAAQLYNATRCSAGLDERWEDMEYVIRVHGEECIFAGGPRPTEVEEYAERYYEILEQSGVRLARPRSQDLSEDLSPSGSSPGLQTASPVKDVFRSRYVDDGLAALSMTNIMAMASNSTKAERPRPASGGDMAELCNLLITQTEITPLQLLQAVREGVASEEMHLLFDYFGLHHRATGLLKVVREKLQAELSETDKAEQEQENPLLDVVARVLDTTPNGNLVPLREASGVIAQFLGLEQGTRSLAVAREAAQC